MQIVITLDVTSYRQCEGCNAARATRGHASQSRDHVTGVVEPKIVKRQARPLLVAVGSDTTALKGEADEAEAGTEVTR